MHLEITSTDRDKAFERASCTVDAMNEIRTTTLPDPGRTMQDVNYLGFLAELAVARMLKVELVQHPVEKPDPGFDMMWQGESVDVKYTYYPNGNLFIKANGKSRADIYILVTGDPQSMHIIGWAKGSDFDYAEMKDYGNRGKPVLALEQCQLRHWG